VELVEKISCIVNKIKRTNIRAKWKKILQDHNGGCVDKSIVESFYQQKSIDSSFKVNDSIHSVTSSAIRIIPFDDSKASKKKKNIKKQNNKIAISSNKNEKESQGLCYPSYLFIQNNTIGGNLNYGCFPPNYVNYGYMTPQIILNSQYQQHQIPSQYPLHFPSQYQPHIPTQYQQHIPSQFQSHNPYHLNQNSNFIDRNMSMNINEQNESRKIYDYPKMGNYK
jgi:hypothetical protein